MKVLFIGGPADGQWREVEYLLPEICIPIFEQCPATISQPNDQMATSKLDTTIYRLAKLAGRFDRHHVYMCQDAITERCVIEALLNGYKP
jgi:hypothetical protein